MHRDYVRISSPRLARSDPRIPSEYWPQRIKELQPIEVYVHRVNIVVVQAITKEIESGTYIYIPISSYLPQTGDDNFTFTSVGDSVYEYQRSRR